MALKSTIYKADLNIADMDRNYYAEHNLTVARHPSETDERLMVRLLAFACHASEYLVFTKGLSDVDEPDLWAKDLTGALQMWIEVGQPDEKRILKACGRSEQVLVLCYATTSHIWWQQTESKVARAQNLQVWNLPAASSAELTKLAQRNMQLQCTIQDGVIWFSSGEESVQLSLERWK
ncbi:MAG: YaeQ family protein [Burkholderiales bacterium]|nr:YaeQ family protein [Burkholderiales bacterium]